ncbi:putative prepilin like protein [Thioalkalivibrio sp. K90mix]|uniref:type IV pilin protein n=1 Tax=Thioalkalivibrio sp. (strain K90mix) TaxID=396595 RepID=UPI000195A38D|nr:type IV pilin protein [Thioalkalivibrio sp. K90mix]ADC70723.1 putative prepilin like protein [Thioalkalivibrio sp. K90mix]
MNTRARFIPAGFTLIELMVVVAVVAILAAIAYPSYQNHVTNTWRANAAGCLTETAQSMERRYTREMSYEGDLPQRGCMNESGMPERYDFRLAEVERAAFRLEAVPQGVQASRDTQCGTLTLNERGERGAAANDNSGECW